ncbi:alpha/beta fold hydrolase [Aurantivibrio plasticivorans]
MKTLIKGLILLVVPLGSHCVTAECVVLLHGLARSSESMETMAERLAEEGYAVVNHDYPSREARVETLAQDEVKKAIGQCPDDEPVHFVTHSMGGILVRHYIANNTANNVLDNIGRVVMLGPPNQWSEVVDELGEIRLFHWINGDAGLQLGTGEDDMPKQLGAANFELGIIAGNWSINWILSSLIPGDDDGKVSVENTKLEGMDDFKVMPVTHPMMMQNDAVIEEVVYFLRYGKFKQEENKNAEIFQRSD